MEFPRFGGDNVRGWLNKCEKLFRVNDVHDEHKVSLVSKHLFDIALLWHELIVKIIGEDVTWLIYKHAILQRFGNVRNEKILINEILRQTGTVVEYSNAFKSLFGIVSFLNDMGEDETHFVDLFVEGLRPEIRSVVQGRNPKSLWSAYFLAKGEETRETTDNGNDSAVLDEVSKAGDEGKGFKVSDAYVKESIEVENGLVDGVVVEDVSSSIEIANVLVDVVGNKDEESKECELLASKDVVKDYNYFVGCANQVFDPGGKQVSIQGAFVVCLIIASGQPYDVLDRRMAKRGNAAAVYVLIQWINETVADATWETYDSIAERFSHLDLDA